MRNSTSASRATPRSSCTPEASHRDDEVGSPLRSSRRLERRGGLGKALTPHVRIFSPAAVGPRPGLQRLDHRQVLAPDHFPMLERLASQARRGQICTRAAQSRKGDGRARIAVIQGSATGRGGRRLECRRYHATTDGRCTYEHQRLGFTLDLPAEGLSSPGGLRGAIGCWRG